MSADFKEYADLIDEMLEKGLLEDFAQFLVTLFAISLGIALVFFVLEAIGLYRINQRLGNKGAILAFVPGFSGYALGAAADGLKKRKPTNYCIHMMMLRMFSLAAMLVYYYFVLGRLLLLYETLRSGTSTDTLALLEQTLTVTRGDTAFYLSYQISRFVGYVASFIAFLCFARILQLFRSKGAFFLLMGSILVPQIVSVYVFVVRYREIYREPPVFRIPGMDEEETDSENGGGNSPFTPHEYPEYPEYSEPEEETPEPEESAEPSESSDGENGEDGAPTDTNSDDRDENGEI